MLYHSTRNPALQRRLAEVTLAGLAPDGGLYVPNSWPHLEVPTQPLSYQQLALEVLSPFIGDAVPSAVVQQWIENAYAPFTQPLVAPLHQLDEQLYVLELFHGPTLAFKDYALQLLARAMAWLLQQNNSQLQLIVATSGDTGAAAAAAFADLPNIDITIFYPHERIVPAQRRQMTTLAATSRNLRVFAVEGSFDDTQRLVKKLLLDPEVSLNKPVAAVNSINWFRLLAQMVYYAGAYQQLPQHQKTSDQPPSFVVPSGNFGNVYAGYALKQTGWPLGQLVAATNHNDALFRLWQDGSLQPSTVKPSLSPAMDILIPSNFERYVANAYGADTTGLAATLANYQTTGLYQLSPPAHANYTKDFMASAVSDAQTLETIHAIHQRYGYILDPHGAVGMTAALRLQEQLAATQPKGAIISLACAHPAKFPEAVGNALGQTPPSHPLLESQANLPEDYRVVPNDFSAVKPLFL
jgi:threonine synthase